jgi:adenosylcobinamide kinase/adenosylcobinamide-phosphate guanylyltransferase
MNKFTLITGGIRSGKSSFAEKKALFYQANPVYIATAVAFDNEMKERISLHQERRGKNFITVEEPADITKVLSGYQNQTILIDCMTINLSNRLLADENKPLSWHIESGESYIDTIISISKKNNLSLIMVSNEVGTSPVCDNRLGRYFQDLQGRWNCRLARESDEVFMIESGIPRTLKKQKCRPFRLSAPSYVLPADYLSNIIYLQDKVDDIQLLLFDSSSDDPLFGKGTISTMNYLSRDGGFTYSAHMPSGPDLMNSYDFRLKETLLILEKLQELNIKDYTFHYDLPAETKKSDKTAIKERVDNLYISYFKTIKNEFPEISISLENTNTEMNNLDNVVKYCNIKYCADIGHYLINNFNLCDIEERLNLTSVIHLHGLKDEAGKIIDHQAVNFSRGVFDMLKNFNGLVTVENYHAGILKKSLDLINDFF